jgi:NRAMP (natural resistance-associated macrophage protein)-like metal ion transporter
VTVNDRVTPDPEAPLPGGAKSKPRLLSIFGPGLIAGASDDDPSGIATYSQAGAQFGYGLGWTMIAIYPLMSAVQMISARIGRTTGHGIAGNLRRHYPNWLAKGIALLLLMANTANIGADLGAMADATALVLGGPAHFYLILFGAVCALVPVFMKYTRYVAILKWLTLALLAYVATLFMVRLPWGEALSGMLLPSLAWDRAYITTIVAVIGTTISPYLFFWQASEEAEDVREIPRRKALKSAPMQGKAALFRIELDTLTGMAAANFVALAIILTTAATLHAQGITNIETSAQAAAALQPIAGSYASVIFALGIIGTGLLAVPVLAGSAAYAIGEASRWPTGLARKPKKAKAFYGTIIAATVFGMILNFSPINPIRALYWSAVINGVVAVPVLTITMLLCARPQIMGPFIVTGWLKALGWLTTALMAAAVAAMFFTAVFWD